MSRLITKADVLFALGFTPYDAANPGGFITPAQIAALAPLAAPQFTGSAQFGGPLLALALVDVQSGALQLSSNAAVLTLGKASQAGTPLLRFLSSGFAARNYDAQFSVTGGSAASDGKGVVNLVCNGFTINGQSIAWGTASPSVSLPLTNGPAALLGTSLNYAREDHVHQSDSTRAAATNPTLDGTVSLGTNTQAALTVQLNGTTASNRRIRLMTAGSVRWTFGVPAGSEPGAGSNAGSDFNVNSYDDNGTILSPVPMVIRRSDGRVTFGGAVVMGGALSGVTSLGMNGALSGVTTYAGSGNAAINLNAAAAPALPSGVNAMLNLTAADTTSNGVMVSTFGTGPQPSYNGRSAGGTAGTLALTPAASTLVMLAGYGHDGSTWAFGGSCELRSSAAWSGTSRPTFWRWSTVAVGATATAQRMQLHPSGNLTIQPAGGTFTDDGVNALQVGGSITATGAGAFGAASVITDATTNSTFALTLSATSNTNGAALKLTGNGATTPSKTIRAKGGNLEFTNNAGGAVASMSDTGALTTADLTLATDASQSAMSGALTSAGGTVTASSGTITTAAGAVRYKKIGRLVLCQVNVSITTAGTGAGTVNFPLPFATTAAGGVLTGRDATTGKTINGLIGASASSVAIQFYDGNYPGAAGANLILSGVYEAST